MSFDFDALQRAVAFAATPYLYPVMRTIEDDRQSCGALSRATPEQVDTVVQQLLDVGAVRKVMEFGSLSSADVSASIRPLILTRKGRRVVQLLRELCEDVPEVPELADDEEAEVAFDRLTKR